MATTWWRASPSAPKPWPSAHRVSDHSVCLGAAHFLGEVHTRQPRPGRGAGVHVVDVEAAVRRMCDRASLRPAITDQPRQPARVDAARGDQALGAQPYIEVAVRPEIRRAGDVGPQDQAARRGPKRLHVFAVGADVADMREGERNDLTGIGRIGEDLLIPGHGRVETHLAHGNAGGAGAKASQDRAVGQHQRRRSRGSGRLAA